MRILGADGLTGVGNNKALDKIPSTYVENGDMCLAKFPETNGESGRVYFYVLRADQGGVENLPNIVVPLDNATVPTNKRWVLTGVYMDEVYTQDIYANTLSQSSSGVPLILNDTISMSGSEVTFTNSAGVEPFSVNSQFMVTNLNAEYWGGIHWSEFDIGAFIKSGDTWIAQGVDTFIVYFPAPQFGTTYSLFTELRNDTDSNPSMYQHVVTNKTTTGFTVKLSGETDTAYHRLQWAILGDNAYYDKYNLVDVAGDDILDIAGDTFQIY